MNILLIYPEFPDTFWSFKHALKFISKKSSFPPLGLLTVAAMLPADCTLRLVDMNIEPLLDEQIAWADLVMTSTMVVQAPSLAGVIRRANRLGVPVAAGGPGTPHPTGRASSESAVMVTEGMFIWPSARREISGWTFHDPGNPGHIGLDIAARMWDPIVAIADGTVVFAEWGGGYGNLVIVDHGDGWDSYYAHLSEFAVEAGEEVRQGQLLGGAGTTGYSTGPHLHFEIRYYGRPVDPHVHLP